MNILERIINEFKTYARHKLDEHAIEIKQQYTGTKINDQTRLEIFNKHLDLLKTELQEKMRDIIKEHKADLNGSVAIPVELFSVYNSFINEFFKKEF